MSMRCRGITPGSSARAIERRWPGALSSGPLSELSPQARRGPKTLDFPHRTAIQAFCPLEQQLDRAFGGACALTEGVATSPDGVVYFSDITLLVSARTHRGSSPKPATLGIRRPNRLRSSLTERHVEQNEI